MSVEDLTPEHPRGSLRTGNVADELARGQVNLSVTLVSPTRALYEAQAHWVVAPGVDGYFGVWPGHEALVAALGGGLLRIGQRGGHVTRFAVRGGFLEVGRNAVTILVDSAVSEAEAPADRPDAERDLQEANAALQHPASDQEFVELQERRAGDQARIKLSGQ